MDQLEVRVHEEINAYKEKFYGLTLRQWIFVIITLLVDVPGYMYFKQYINENILQMIIILFSLPMGAFGFLTVQELPFEKFLRYFKRGYMKLYKPLEYKTEKEAKIEKEYYESLSFFKKLTYKKSNVSKEDIEQFKIDKANKKKNNTKKSKKALKQQKREEKKQAKIAKKQAKEQMKQEKVLKKLKAKEEKKNNKQAKKNKQPATEQIIKHDQETTMLQEEMNEEITKQSVSKSNADVKSHVDVKANKETKKSDNVENINKKSTNNIVNQNKPNKPNKTNKIVDETKILKINNDLNKKEKELKKSLNSTDKLTDKNIQQKEQLLVENLNINDLSDAQLANMMRAILNQQKENNQSNQGGVK